MQADDRDTIAHAAGPASELRLTVVAPDGRRDDVIAEIEATLTVDELAATLAAHLCLDIDEGAAGLKSERLDSSLPGAAEVAVVGIRDGDVLIARRKSRREATQVPGMDSPVLFDLSITSGPAAGERHSLSAGSYRIGRDPTCEIAIDDPSLSRSHLELRVAPTGVMIRDTGSSNGSMVGATVLAADQEWRLKADEPVEIGRTVVTVSVARAADSPNWAGQRAFNRPPRMARPFAPAEMTVPAPPLEPSRPGLPIIGSLLPLVFGVVMWRVLGQVYMLLFTLLTPVMAVGSYVSDRGSGRRAYKRQVAAFRSRLEQLATDLDEARSDEASALSQTMPDPAEVLSRVRSLSPDLWERRPDDDDFMAFRLGLADQPARTTVKFKEGGREELRVEAQAVIERHAMLPSVPAAVHLRKAGTLGLSGPAEGVAALARGLIAQAAALHSPAELIIAAAISTSNQPAWEWLKWLPHTAQDGSPIEGGQLFAGRQGARQLLLALGVVLAARRDEAGGAFGGAARHVGPFILVMIDEAVAADRSLIAELLSEGPAHGIGVIWLGHVRHDLPGQCGAIAELHPTLAKLELTMPRSGTGIEDVSLDGMKLVTAEELARGLAPIRDRSAAAGTMALPRRVGLIEALEMTDVSAPAMISRWDERSRGLGGVIGRQAGGPLTLDLRADGPHALIAGTTGAGKSELLQTLVASLASRHPPTRLNFLLIDYKGGAAFRECFELPHAVGMITDLDEFLTRRALASLNAELRRRERVLDQASAKSLIDMERRQPESAPANLVIVVDEFATLVKEVPEFVEGVVDVAQRGRSLGVHLVLATQRPGGVVSENIRANTNLRVALRVSSPAESDDVISAPDAGRIPRSLPGRAYARTGHGELTAFQAAYAGATSGTGTRVAQVRIRNFEFDQRAEPAVTSSDDGAAQPADEVPTDLMRVVAVARQAVREAGIRVPPAPWLPQLPDVLKLDELLASTRHDGDGTMTIGLIDEPTHQRQRPLTLDLQQEGSALIYGTTGSGKTALLRTIAASLAANHKVEELHLYGLDFAGRGLGVLETLPHCGSVIAGEDRERLQRLLRLLVRTIQRRHDAFAASGASNLTEHRKLVTTGATNEPRIVVLLDSYGGFAAAYDRSETGDFIDTLNRLIAEGRAAGIHFLITGDRRAAIPPSVFSSVSRKLVLRLGEEDEYGALGLDGRAVRGARLPAGRGFTENDLQFQAALVGSDTTGEGQARAFAGMAASIAARHAGKAEPILKLPLSVAAAGLPIAAPDLQGFIGIRDSDLAPALADLTEAHFLIAGPYRSGRTTALGTLAAGLKAGQPALELHLLAPRRSALTEWEGWTSVARGADACCEQAKMLAEAVAASGTGGRLVICLDDAGELADAPCAGALEALVRRGRDGDLRIIAAFETQSARGFSAWVRELRKDGHGLLLDPDPAVDGDLLAVRLPRRATTDLPPGRGYLVAGGTAELVQVAS